MKVASMCVGLASGYSGAFNRLDQRTADLDARKIHSVKDTFYPKIPNSNAQGDETVVRVVVYDE